MLEESLLVVEFSFIESSYNILIYLQLMNGVYLDSIASSETDLRVFKPWK